LCRHRSRGGTSVTRDDISELLLEGLLFDVCDSLGRGESEIMARLIVDKPKLEADLSSTFLAAEECLKKT